MSQEISKRNIKPHRPDSDRGEDNESCIAEISEIIEDVRNGTPVILIDDEDRENEGDLIIAAQMATPENINFMAKFARGLICLPMEKAMTDRLGLELMGRGDNVRHRTAFTVSIEAKEGVTTGISAADRAKTIQTAVNPETQAMDIATPGHVFPLIAQEGGVLVRAGHTEASVDLAKMAGFSPAGVICEIMNDDGTMARLPDLVSFAQHHGLKIGTIADLIAYRRQNEKLVKDICEREFESVYGGPFRLHIFESEIYGVENIALVKGDVSEPNGPVLVRMHAINILKDALGGVLDSPNDTILRKSMELIGEKGCGVIVIIRETNPKSLSQMLLSEETVPKPKDTSETGTLRNYGVGAQILRHLGVRKMTLITNAPKNIIGLDGYGLEIVDHHSFENLNAKEEEK